MKQWELRTVTVDPEGMPFRSDPPRSVDASLRVLIDQIPALVWTTDSGLVLTSWVGARIDRLGLGPNQLVGMALGDLLEGADPQAVTAHRRALDGESLGFDVRWGDHSFHGEVGPLRDTAGEIIGTICVALDRADHGAPAGAGVSAALSLG
jgi:PAS domain-containing protein